MVYALVGYPLSAGYRERLEQGLGVAPVYLTVPELRRMSTLVLLHTLLSLRGHRVLLPLEDLNGQALLPIFQGIAAVSPARRIEVVYPDLRSERVSRLRTMFAAFGMMNASVASGLSAWRCARELDSLLHIPRAVVSGGSGKQVLYLKTNLWFGVKAGGSVGHIAGVVNELAQEGYHVDFAATEPPVMLDGRVRYIHIPPPTTFGLPSELNCYRYQEIVVREISRRYAHSRPTFIYQRMSIANYAGVVLSRHLERPLVLEYNGSEAWVAKHWGRALRYHDLAVRAEDACLKHAHLVVTVSDVLRDELIERGVEPERIVVYPNCVDPEVFDPARYPEAERKAFRRRSGIAPDAVEDETSRAVTTGQAR